MTAATRLSVAWLIGACGVSTATLADTPAAPARGDEVRATVAEMLADAESRSSLLAGADAGHDGMFFLAGEGFRLNVGGSMKFRYILNFRDDTATDDGFEPGFQNRFTRLHLSGKVHENWGFDLLAQFDAEGSCKLLDALATYSFNNGWTLLWGQTTAPIVREDMMGDEYLLDMEYSNATTLFAPGRVQCVGANYTAEDWRLWVTFNDGAASLNTDFTADPADYALSGRFEYKFAGEWARFNDHTSKQGEPFAAMVGGAAHFQESPNSSDPADTDTELLLYTFDVSLEGDGWNAFAGFIGTHTEMETLSSSSELDDFSVVVQGGIRVTEIDELFARWDGLFFDDDRGFEEDNYNFLTIGYNRYIAGHAVKFTVDGVYSLEDTSDLVGAGLLPNTNLGLLGDTDDGEVVIRFQMQLLF